MSELPKRDYLSVGRPLPEGAGYTPVVSGDFLMNSESKHPFARHQCPKCGYTITTNEAPQEWKCPIDGEVLEGIPLQ